MGDHAAYKYSVRVATTDLAVLHCLRALADLSELGAQKKIAWGGTGEREWKLADNTVKFHFSSPDFRKAFLQEAKRVLVAGKWEPGAESNSDPATPKKKRR